MMMNDDTYEKLDDYLDDLLPDDERRALEASLAVDAELRDELTALRALREETAHLTREISPTRDLWPDIEARMSAARAGNSDSIVTFRRPDRSIRRKTAWVYLAAAAAMLLMMLGLPLVLNRAQPPAVAPTTPVAVAPSLTTGDKELQRVAAQYVAARDQLAALLAQRRGDIAPETLAVVEENLTVISTAVTQIETALAVQPDSPKLERLLYAAYQSEVDLLRRAVELTDDPQSSHEADDVKGGNNAA